MIYLESEKWYTHDSILYFCLSSCCVCVLLTDHKLRSVEACNEINLLHEDFVSECGPSDLLASYQEENLCHCNTRESSCRSKQMNYIMSSITGEQ
jgi:hypothetical protein